MTVQTVAGTTIAISAGTPATWDATGYAALTFTNIGEITDGGEHGRTYAEVTHMPIDNRSTQKFKGSFNEGTKTLQLAVNDDDAGQVIAKAALVSDADYSFEVTYQDGAIDYFQAKVMSFVKAATGVDTIRSATMQLSITTSSTGVGIIEVAAP